MRPRPAMTHSAGTHTSHPLELSLTLQGNIVWVDRHERHGMGAVSLERQAAGCGGEQDGRAGASQESRVKSQESSQESRVKSRVKSQVPSDSRQQAVTMRPRPAMTHSAGTHTSHPLELSLTLQGNIVWVDRHERHGMGAVSLERQAAGCGEGRDKREARGTSQSEPEQAKSEERNKMQAKKERWSSSVEQHGARARGAVLVLVLVLAVVIALIRVAALFVLVVALVLVSAVGLSFIVVNLVFALLSWLR